MEIKKILFGMTLILLIASMLMLILNGQLVKGWSGGTIYIRADGSIDPPTAPISTVDYVTYTLTGNITSDADGIVVERDNIVIYGDGYTLQGTGESPYKGVYLDGRSNVTIKNTTITTFYNGIWLRYSSNNSITGNNIANNYYGIFLLVSSNNSVYGNNIANNWFGIQLWHSSNNSITGNNIAGNTYGIWLDYSSNNNIYGNNIAGNGHGIHLYESSNNSICGNNITANSYGIILWYSSNIKVFHNNFINNLLQAFSYWINVWDDGYPSGGNYWSNYAYVDLYSGSYQNETGSDGICDYFYKIDENNQDNYPLMGMFYDFEVVGFYNKIYHVEVISNSTVSELNLVVWLSSPNEYLQPGREFLQFYVEGENDTSGFCRITIPKALLNDSYTVLVDWTVVPAHQLDVSNSTHVYLYFTYNHTKHEVIIIPEFTLTLILPLFLIATLIIIILARVKAKQHQNQISMSALHPRPPLNSNV
jgi:parallel beta-helix repeat protein